MNALLMQPCVAKAVGGEGGRGEEGTRGRMRGWRGLDGVEGRGAEGRERKGRRQALRLAPSCCCSFISPASSAPSMVRIPRVYHWLAIAAPTPCTLHSCCTTCIRSLLSTVASRLSLGAQRSRTGAFARAARRRGPVTWAGPHGRAAACQWGPERLDGSSRVRSAARSLDSPAPKGQGGELRH
jgi:hypothetical protein